MVTCAPHRLMSSFVSGVVQVARTLRPYALATMQVAWAICDFDNSVFPSRVTSQKIF